MLLEILVPLGPIIDIGFDLADLRIAVRVKVAQVLVVLDLGHDGRTNLPRHERVPVHALEPRMLRGG